VRIPEARKNAINNALKTPIKKNFNVNSTANFLHPQVQYLKRAVPHGAAFFMQLYH
jgi:hypothetical protein